MVNVYAVACSTRPCYCRTHTPAGPSYFSVSIVVLSRRTSRVPYLGSSRRSRRTSHCPVLFVVILAAPSHYGLAAACSRFLPFWLQPRVPTLKGGCLGRSVGQKFLVGGRKDVRKITGGLNGIIQALLRVTEQESRQAIKISGRLHVGGVGRWKVGRSALSAATPCLASTLPPREIYGQNPSTLFHYSDRILSSMS